MTRPKNSRTNRKLNQTFRIALKLEITCEERRVPRGRVRTLFHRVYEAIRKELPLSAIAPSIMKIIEILCEHLKGKDYHM